MFTEFYKPSLDDVLDWQSIPADVVFGTLMLKHQPEEQFSEGGLSMPGKRERRRMGVMWVVRAIGGAETWFTPGDSVVLAEIVADAGVPMPPPHDDVLLVDARDVKLRLPFEEAKKQFVCRQIEADRELDARGPEIEALAAGGDLESAQRLLELLRPKIAVMSGPAQDRFSGLLKKVVEVARTQMAAMEAENRRQEEEAHDKLVAARQQNKKHHGRKPPR